MRIFAGRYITRFDTDGIVDSSFGASGLVIVDFGAVANLHDVALQPDGKLVAVGSVTVTVFNIDFGDGPSRLGRLC